jgi:hypothetical protein
MAFNSNGVTLGRGQFTTVATGDGIATHSYKWESDTLATIATADYFPDYLGGRSDEVLINDILIARGSDSVDTFTITAVSPLTIEPQAEATGNVTGPVSSTLNAIPRYTDTTGKVLGSTGITIDGSNNVTTTAQVNAGTLNVTGITSTFGNTSTASSNSVHARGAQSINLWLESDTGNDASEVYHGALVLTQDGNNTMCRIGHAEDNQVRIVISAGGSLTNGGVVGTLPTITPGTDKLTIPAAALSNLVANPGVTGNNYTFTTVAANPGSTATLWVRTSDGHLMFGATDLTP